MNNNLSHILRVSRYAKTNGYGELSTGEQLAAALVLNRADWLAEMGYTMPEAIDRIGPEWSALLIEAQRAVDD
jgi:hypothetical protein